MITCLLYVTYKIQVKYVVYMHLFPVHTNPQRLQAAAFHPLINKIKVAIQHFAKIYMKGNSMPILNEEQFCADFKYVINIAIKFP